MRRTQKKSHRTRNIIISIIVIIVLAIVGIGGYAMHNLKQAAQNSYYPTTNKSSNPANIKQSKPNFAFRNRYRSLRTPL